MHLIILKWLRIQKSRQKRKAMRQRGRSERRSCQRKYFHSFNFIIDHASIHFFFYVNTLYCFMWLLLNYLLFLLSSDHFAALTSIAILVCTDEFFKNYPPKRIFRNESISNLENVLQRNLRTDTARECIFKVSECINLEKIFRSAPTMVASSWVRCVYQCDHKNHGYVTDSDTQLDKGLFFWAFPGVCLRSFFACNLHFSCFEWCIHVLYIWFLLMKMN